MRCRLYIFAYSTYEHHHLRSSVNFTIHKFKPDKLKAGTVKSNLKGTTKRSVAMHLHL